MPAKTAFKIAILLNKLNLDFVESSKLIYIFKCINSFTENEQSQFDGFLKDYEETNKEGNKNVL